MAEAKDPNGRFVRMDQVKGSYNDYVCYLGVEQSTGIQVYWYEFMNDKLPEKDRDEAFQNLSKAKNIPCPILLNILDLWKTSVPPKFIVITEAAQSLSLVEYMRTIDSRPSKRNLLKWFKNLATAVSALHHLNIRHGSLSLNKVFIKPGTGVVKLRLPLTTLSGRVTSPSSITLEKYNAPERLKGKKSLSNDIWALGIILIELLTGEEPYKETKTPQELFAALVNNKAPDLINSIDSASARDLISKCLQPDSFRITIDEVLAHPVFSEIDQAVDHPQSTDTQKSTSNLPSPAEPQSPDIEELI